MRFRILFVTYLSVLTCALLSLSSIAEACPPGADYGPCNWQKAMTMFVADRVASIENLASGPYEEYEPPNDQHHRGCSHIAMYRVFKIDGPHLIKVWNGGVREGRRAMFGALLAEGVGGPKIFGSGRYSVDESGSSYYIEMEELFAGESDSATYKGAPIGKKIILSPTLLENLSSLLVKLIENNVRPSDLDFIYHGGNAHWVDTSEWDLNIRRPLDKRWFNEPFIPVGYDVEAFLNGEGPMDSYAAILTQFARMSRSEIELLKVFRQKFVASKILSTAQKLNMWNNLVFEISRDINLHETDRSFLAQPCSVLLIH